MSQQNTPPVWQMVRQAVEEVGEQTTNIEVRDWILEHYPETNKNTIDPDSHSIRSSYPDFLFLRDDGVSDNKRE